MDECPECNRWTLDYDPRIETQICANCGYEKHISYDDFIKEKNVVNNLLYPSRRPIAEFKKAKWRPKLKYPFHFYSSEGHGTGQSATSIEDFAEKIKKVDAKSLEFHLNRKDFEKWIAESLGDMELVEEINNLYKQNPVGETLRNQLYIIVSKRSVEIKAKPMATP